MATAELITAARQYVTARAAEGVVALSASDLASSLKVDELIVVEVLAFLQSREHLVRLAATVDCPFCHEAIGLTGGDLDQVAASLDSLIAEHCPECGEHGISRSRVRVHLSFFCTPVAVAAGYRNSASSEIPLAPTQRAITSLTYEQLQGAVFNVSTMNYINADRGAEVNLGTRTTTTAGRDVAGGSIVKGGGDAATGDITKVGANSPSSDNEKPWWRNAGAIAAILAALITAVGGVVVAVIADDEQPTANSNPPVNNPSK